MRGPNDSDCQTRFALGDADYLNAFRPSHPLGVTTPYDLFQTIQSYNTIAVSDRVKADVLLLAGGEDHYVPLHQLYRQAEALTNVRSLTMRVFTRAEQAHNHVHVGNIGLSLRFIANWLDLVMHDHP